MGLIMGGTLLRKDLDSAVDKVSATARRDVRVSELQSPVGSSISDRQLVHRELEKAEVRFVFLFIFYCFVTFVHSSSEF